MLDAISASMCTPYKNFILPTSLEKCETRERCKKLTILNFYLTSLSCTVQYGKHCQAFTVLNLMC